MLDKVNHGVGLHLLGKAIDNHAAGVNPANRILGNGCRQQFVQVSAIRLFPQHLLQALYVNAEPHVVQTLVLGILEMRNQALTI